MPRALGRYGVLTIDQARDKARKWLEWMSQGIDSAAHRETEDRTAEVQKAEQTFGKVFDLFIKQHLSKLRTGAYVEMTMRRVFAKWWDRPLSSISHKDVIAIIYENARPRHPNRG